MGDQKDELPNHFNKMPIDGWDGLQEEKKNRKPEQSQRMKERKVEDRKKKRKRNRNRKREKDTK